MNTDDPFRILGLEPGAADDEIRAAYLRKIREHPPDRDPEQFERVRDAYAELSNPRERIQKLLFSGDPLPPMASLLEGQRPARRHVGPKPWLAVLREP